jgi:hypothetical protein
MYITINNTLVVYLNFRLAPKPMPNLHQKIKTNCFCKLFAVSSLTAFSRSDRNIPRCLQCRQKNSEIFLKMEK